MNKIASLALLMALLAPAISAAKEPSFLKDDSEDKKAPLQVTSDRMVSDNKNNTISFFGSVVAIKGKLKVEADEMHVLTDEERNEFREIEAIGSVKITRGKKIATGQKAHYYADQQKIVLTGDPVLKDGENIAKGEKVIYYFDKEDMEIFGGADTPSTVILYPKEKSGSGGEEKAGSAP